MESTEIPADWELVRLNFTGDEARDIELLEAAEKLMGKDNLVFDANNRELEIIRFNDKNADGVPAAVENLRKQFDGVRIAQVLKQK